MDFDPVFLSRLQFGFVISFHIISPNKVATIKAREVSNTSLRKV